MIGNRSGEVSTRSGFVGYAHSSGRSDVGRKLAELAAVVLLDRPCSPDEAATAPRRTPPGLEVKCVTIALPGQPSTGVMTLSNPEWRIPDEHAGRFMTMYAAVDADGVALAAIKACLRRVVLLRSEN